MSVQDFNTTQGNKALKELHSAFFWQATEPGCLIELIDIIRDWQGGKASCSQTVKRLDAIDAPKTEKLVTAIANWKLTPYEPTSIREAILREITLNKTERVETVNEQFTREILSHSNGYEKFVHNDDGTLLIKYPASPKSDVGTRVKWAKKDFSYEFSGEYALDILAAAYYPDAIRSHSEGYIGVLVCISPKA